MSQEIKNFVHPDLHMHSTFSDGTDSIEVLLENVRKAGVDIFALTDHDTYLGCAEMKKILKDDDPYFIGGIELSCEDEFGKYHILGYCYDTEKPSIKECVDYTHNSRLRKFNKRLDYLKENGYIFKDEDIENLKNNENPGKPHLAKMLVKYGYKENLSDAFDLLDKCKTHEVPLSPLQAIDAILQADGIPVLAHGLFGSGSQRLSEIEIDERLNRLKSYGLMGAECYYEKFNNEQIELMLKLANKYNLLVTAGSDYHGSVKPAKLGDTKNPDQNIMKRFYRNVELLLSER